VSSIADTSDEDNIPTVSLEDVETSDESATDQGVSSVLFGGRNPFVNAANFNFSISRFKIRGYDNDFFETFMNGIPTEYINNGYSSYNLWAGLNDVTRNRENILGLRLSTFSYGSIGGVNAIDSRAAKQRKQLSVTIGTSNRTYDLRGGLTYGSGITKKGWSFAVSAFVRWAKYGYVKGTDLISGSYFASVQKMFKNHSLALTVFGVPTKQGKATTTVQEAYDLAGSNYYNPSWGYQNGKIRNSKVENRHQPVFILTHEWKPKENMNLLTGIGYSFGERTLSGFDRYHANDPRPDYYKYLPSWQIYDGHPELYAGLVQAFKDDPNLLQINWDRIYANNTDQTSATFVQGDPANGNTISGKRAHYILRDEVQSQQRFNLNPTYNVSVKKFDITAGLTYQFQQTKNFKRVRDLLGSDFYKDVDEFVESDSMFTNPLAANSDLNHPNRFVKVGDTYGYNYAEIIHKTSIWGQVLNRTKYVDWFIGGEFSNTIQYRIGYYKNGLNPDNSEGTSKKISSLNYNVKAGITYKINGRNYLFANGSYGTRAPYWSKIFISPRTTNRINDDIKSETMGSIEVGYIYNSPKIKISATGYFTDFKNGSNSIVFYFSDAGNEALGNYTVTNINKIHYGGELGVEAALYKGLSLNFAAAAGKYYYTSRQLGTITADTRSDIIDKEVIYSKNFRVANTPQQAYSLGLFYRSPKFWYVGANVNFFDRMYTEFAPTHRTERATELVPYQSDQWYDIIDQERLSPKGQWTLDMSGGYSWRLKSTFKNMKGKDAGKYYLVLNTGISNLTNNKKFIVSGREQLRYDYEKKTPNVFPSKYSYAYGINFYLNLIFRM